MHTRHGSIAIIWSKHVAYCNCNYTLLLYNYDVRNYTRMNTLPFSFVDMQAVTYTVGIVYSFQLAELQFSPLMLEKNWCTMTDNSLISEKLHYRQCNNKLQCNTDRNCNCTVIEPIVTDRCRTQYINPKPIGGSIGWGNASPTGIQQFYFFCTWKIPP